MPRCERVNRSLQDGDRIGKDHVAVSMTLAEQIILSLRTLAYCQCLLVTFGVPEMLLLWSPVAARGINT